MTDHVTQAAELVEVTQADRDAAKPIAIRVALGELTHEQLHQAFARHRIAAIAAIGPSEYERGFQAAKEGAGKRITYLSGSHEGTLSRGDGFVGLSLAATAISNMEPGK